MDLLTVTTTEAVRAVLGVSDAANELPDQYFLDRMLDSALLLELQTWLPGTLDDLLDAAEAAASPMDSDSLIWNLIQQASTYWCAWACCDNLGLGFFARIEDGQNKAMRPTIDYEKLAARLWSAYQSYKARARALSAPVAAASTSWAAGVSSPSFDPITGV